VLGPGQFSTCSGSLPPQLRTLLCLPFQERT
jgi:hypothetical protein